MKLLKITQNSFSGSLDSRSNEEKLEAFKNAMAKESVWGYLSAWKNIDQNIDELKDRLADMRQRGNLSEGDMAQFKEELKYMRDSSDFLESTIKEWKDSHQQSGGEL